MIRLPTSGVDDPRYESNWGWVPGLGHSVVAFGSLPNGDVIIGDPSIGREFFASQGMQVLWHGEGICMQKQSQ
ncbi:MAG: hypothetical protein R3C05_22665 [Pirellulaceae bacterium]